MKLSLEKTVMMIYILSMLLVETKAGESKTGEGVNA